MRADQRVTPHCSDSSYQLFCKRMHMTSPYHRLTIAFAVATTMLGLTGFATSAHAAKFPPLNDPATKETHPGKFVWAELFTNDSAAAAKFYTGVFGWTAVTLDQHGVTYTVFNNGNHPVAGLRERTSSTVPHASRWINFIAVTDIESTLSSVTKAGGEVRAPARRFPRIGTQAIITDIEGSPVGLLQSSSGDSADNEPAPGDWNWFHLFETNPPTAAGFYRQVFNYEVTPDSRPGKQNQFILSSDEFNRGSVSVLPDREGAKPGWLGVIRVTNLDETLARVPALGGEVAVAPHSAAFGSRFAVINDPTGGTVGVVEYENNSNPGNHQ
jgi:predicted enzyme related to lactoylglutathione lyase